MTDAIVRNAAVSLTPCMLLFCTSEGSATGTAIRRRGLFSVNILGAHQSDLSARFTGQVERRSGDLTAKKHGRRTIILPDDLRVWLKTLPDARD